MKKINLITWLAGFLVVALGIMAYITLIKSPTAVVDTQIQELAQQSESDEVASIEEDSNETDFDDLDRELIDIENELNASY